MIYEFQCDECGYTFERNLPTDRCKEPTTKPCPACNKIAVKRVFGAAIVSGAMDVHTRAEKVGGEPYKEVMKNIKKAGGAFNSVNI